MSKPWFPLLLMSATLAWPLIGHAESHTPQISVGTVSPYRGLVEIPAVHRVHQWKSIRQTQNCLILAGWKALCWTETKQVPQKY